MDNINIEDDNYDFAQEDANHSRLNSEHREINTFNRFSNNEELQNKIGDLYRLLKSKISENNKYQQKIKKLNKCVNDNSLIIDSSQKEFFELKEKIKKKYEAKIKILENENQRLKSENQRLKKEIKELKNNNNITFEKKVFIPFKVITKNNDDYGCNDIFEVFNSLKNKKNYLASPNKNPDKNRYYNIDIYNLNERYDIVKKLEGHTSQITLVRYFTDKISKGYLISSDRDKNIFIWDVTDTPENFHRKNFIKKMKYEDDIFSCLILFNINNNDYLITSTLAVNNNINSRGIQNYSSSKYIINDLELIDDGYVHYTNNNETYYLLYWNYNNQHYLIELCNGKVVVVNLFKKEIYKEFTSKSVSGQNYCGFIYKKNNIDFLFHTVNNGYVMICNLINKTSEVFIHINGTEFFHIIKFTEKYFIVADDNNNRNYPFKIINIDTKKNVTENNNKYSCLTAVCIKKFHHPTKGDCLITCGKDNKAKNTIVIIWVMENK